MAEVNDPGLEGIRDAAVENETYDPFGNDVQQAQLIVLMKIYDALMTILTDSNASAAKALDDAHSRGIITGLGPQFSHFANRET